MKASSPQAANSGIGLPIATLIAILTTLIVNALSNFFPPRGLNIGAVANTILQGVQITPANYAFAIWGVIYVALIAYGIYQFQPAQRGDATLRRVDVLLIIACLAQIAWVYLFTLQQFWGSVVAILLILLPLIGAYLQLHNRQQGQRSPRSRHWQVHVPFSIYLAWISVATIVNIASALYSSGWEGGGISPQVWTAIMLSIGAVIGAIAAIQRADVAFTLVFIWAYVAVAVRQWDDPVIWVTAGAEAIGLALVLGISKLRSSRPS